MFRHHFATFGNTIEICQISAFQRILFAIFLKVFNIYLTSNILKKVSIVILR